MQTSRRVKKFSKALAIVFAACLTLSLTACAPSWNEKEIQFATMDVPGVLGSSVETIRNGQLVPVGVSVDAVVHKDLSEKQLGQIADGLVRTVWEVTDHNPETVKVRLHETQTGTGKDENIKGLPTLDLREPMRSMEWPSQLLPYMDTISLRPEGLVELYGDENNPKEPKTLEEGTVPTEEAPVSEEVK